MRGDLEQPVPIKRAIGVLDENFEKMIFAAAVAPPRSVINSRRFIAAIIHVLSENPTTSAACRCFQEVAKKRCAVRLSYQLVHVAARTSRQRQIISASCPRLVVQIATLAGRRATVAQNPTANPIVAAPPRVAVATHYRS